VRVSSKSCEAQRGAGHNGAQWKRFLKITHEETENMVLQLPHCSSWVNVPANHQEALLQRLNHRLKAESIPTIGNDVLDWRMSQSFREVRR
ncbi:hypothetical protein BDY21DRAFT_273869, partial [Lineolata rhizophorae]